MKAVKLQAAFARRREQDQMKIKKSAAANTYFHKWDRITTRFEQWTTPEYYKSAEDTCKANRDKELKISLLEKRREKLRKLLDEENWGYETELNGTHLFLQFFFGFGFNCIIELSFLIFSIRVASHQIETYLYKNFAQH